MLRVFAKQIVKVTPLAFVADASDLGIRAGQPAPDAIQVVAECGRVLVFTRSATIRAPEREVAGWDYSHGRGPSRATLTLYND